MITINKCEKEQISERFPNVHIVRTMKHKSKRHKYYCEEAPRVMKYLNSLRGNTHVAENKKEGAHNRYRKTSKRD